MSRERFKRVQAAVRTAEERRVAEQIRREQSTLGAQDDEFPTSLPRHLR
jgi:hypothetical protein